MNSTLEVELFGLDKSEDVQHHREFGHPKM